MKYHEGSSFSLQCQYVQAYNAGQRGHADGGWQDDEEVVDGAGVFGRRDVRWWTVWLKRYETRSGYSDARELDL